MRHPRILVCSLDDWLANQLRPLAAERRWLLTEFRQLEAALAPAQECRPTVILLQLDAQQAKSEPFEWLVQVRSTHPDAAIIVAMDTKMSDADRLIWTAHLLDLGVRLVLFPPLTRPVLEDAVLGLMNAVLQRTARPGITRTGESISVVDLAEEGEVLE